MNHPVALFTLMLAASNTVQAAGVDDFAVTLPLDADAARSAAWQVELGTEVYAWSTDGALRDVIVVNADGQPVPTMAWSPTPSTSTAPALVRAPLLMLPSAPAGPLPRDLAFVVERDAEGRLRSLEARDVEAGMPQRAIIGRGGTRAPASGGPGETPADTSSSAEWLVDLAAFPDGIDTIAFTWSAPTDGVVARFSIEAGDDLQQWRRLRSDATVVLLDQSGTRIDRRTIPLEPLRATYLRLRRADPGPALEGLAVEVRARTKGAPPPAMHWIAAQAITPAAGSRHVDYTLPAAVPFEAVRIGFAQANALADLTLSTATTRPAHAEPSWSTRARFVAFRLSLDGSVVDSGEIPVPASSRVRDLRLEAASGSLSAPALEVGYRPARLVFLAEGPAPYRLAVGSVRERRTDAPLEAALATLRARSGADWQPPLAAAGAVVEAGGKRALEAAPVDDGGTRKLALWIVLVAGAALVAGLSLSLLRSTRRKD